MAKYKMPAVGTMLPGKDIDPQRPGGAADQDAVLKFQQDQAVAEAWRRTQVAVEEFTGRLDSWLEYVYRTGRAIGPTGKVGDPKAMPPFGPPLAYFAVWSQNDDNSAAWWDVRQVELSAVVSHLIRADITTS